LLLELQALRSYLLGELLLDGDEEEIDFEFSGIKANEKIINCYFVKQYILC
jgi:hypothetical protein